MMTNDPKVCALVRACYDLLKVIVGEHVAYCADPLVSALIDRTLLALADIRGIEMETAPAMRARVAAVLGVAPGSPPAAGAGQTGETVETHGWSAPPLHDHELHRFADDGGPA